MQDISPASGWALNYIVGLDAHAPGVAGAFLRASGERRQVVAALLSTTRPPSDPKASLELAKVIGQADHRSILARAFGSAPVGMRGALARAGSQPHPRAFYRILFHLLSGEERTAMVVRRMRRIDLRRLNVVRRLPDDIRTVNVVELIESAAVASQVSAIMDLLTANGVDRAAIVQSLTKITSTLHLSEFWKRWAMKCSFPAHPIEASESYRPIENGTALRELAIRYRNCCSHRFLVDSLEGQCAFAEFINGGEGAVIHLTRNDDQWTLDGMYGVDNGPVSSDLSLKATAHLARHGIYEQPRPVQATGGWNVLRSLARTTSFDLAFE